MKKAILLLNMGGPNNLDEVKLFLKNMFNDKRIIGAPKLIRKLIAFIIIKSRLKEATNNYRQLGGKSPIIAYTEKLVELLNIQLDADVFYVMRYTPPFAKDVLPSLKDYDKIFAIPLYPHYSTTTTASSYDDLFLEAKKLNLENRIQTIHKYYSNKNYNEAIVQRIKEALGTKNPKEYELVFSAHGLTQKIIDSGDVYQKHIKQNVYYARKELAKQGINFHKTHLAYQSRVGPMQWIKPYLEDKLASLELKKVIIYPIAFTIDNSETEFELDVEYKELAQELGFEEYIVAKSLNTLMGNVIKDLYKQMGT
ncbi:ferrochelatase [Malaciobacter halophilus]|uniref:Ferrochelatase n=1 Tax=Malaciobacter halophilus TaxID=197482 RepID=A0A2N1J0I5_9BACT|nr:ferrochelatase [Malaciobacter halophilus]AXH10382.1 ferrochelatase [Malaciobacter halophilus]PKI80022.1 ferrochelatase [Malaciobacter halophilus]